MKLKKIIILSIVLLSIVSCNQTINNKFDGSYSLNINTFGVNINSKIDLIINGDKMNYNGEIIDCKQFDDRVEIGKGKVVFTNIDGDLVVNIPIMGKVRYVRISGENNLNL